MILFQLVHLKSKVEFDSEYAIFIFLLQIKPSSKLKLTDRVFLDFDDVVGELEALVWVPLVAGFQQHA